MQKEDGIALIETMSFEPPHRDYIPLSEYSSYRVQGGTSSLISALTKFVREENIKPNTHILEISEENDHLRLRGQNGREYLCHQLAVAMPPGIMPHP